MMLRVTRRDFLAKLSAVVSTTLLPSSLHGTIDIRPPLDLVIRGGSIIDGTGAVELRGDVGIRDGKIVAIGRLGTVQAKRIINARGLKVVPGFIDIHSHVDTELLKNPRADSKVRQGVTTEVTGLDGESVAPLGGPELERNLSLFRSEFGFECPYRDMNGFFTLLEKRSIATNILSMVGLGTVRAVVMGMDNRPPRSDEMVSMKQEVLKAIEQGCWGLSTGLEYTPGSFATGEEIWQILRAVPERYRLYSTHIRNEDNTLLEAIEEAITIARKARARLQVSHLKASYKINWYKQDAALRLLKAAVQSGMSVHADRYPYIAYSTDMAALFPLWARDGGTEKFLARLKDREVLPKIREAVEKKVGGLGSWDAIMISGVKTEPNKRHQGRTIQSIADSLSVDPFEYTVALMLQEETMVSMVGFGMDEAGTEKVLAWRHTMVASDAGAFSPANGTSRPHPRAYGTFPRAIAHYQRKRKITSLPDMVRKMTSLPAGKLGLKDRGVIAKGKAADVVIFDYNTVEDRATFLNPHQFPEGIRYVVVNGVLVVDDGRQTDAFPGRVLRSS